MSWISTTIAEFLSAKLSLSKEELGQCFSPSRNPKEGDYTLASFAVAKKLKKNPVELTTEWLETLKSSTPPCPLTSSMIASGPYLNFKLLGPAVAEGLLYEILTEAESWGCHNDKKDETVCLDFSSPNIAKPFAIHHIRSTLIGASLARLLETQGYQVEKINHLGDWGTQFGYVMEAYKRFWDGKELGDEPLVTLVELYQKITRLSQDEIKEGKNDIQEKAREWFKKLENGDDEALRLWKWFREVSVEELRKIYDRMGIQFDSYRGEAHYEDQLEATIDIVDKKGLLVESDGAMVVEMGEKNPPLLLKKSDGATLYATRDLAALFDRWERSKYTFNIYVVASQQNLHFKQLFSVVDKLGHPSSGKNIHVAFGMMRFDGATFKTRGGSDGKSNVIYLHDVLNTAKQKAREKLELSKMAEDIDKDLVAEQVGLGAVYFNDLKSKRIKDINFSWDDIINFEGRTGAYLQYAQARMGSILRKGEYESGNAFDAALLQHPREKDLLLMIDKFPDVLKEAAKEFEPNTVINYLFDLVQVYSSLTQDKVEGVKVLVGDMALRKARLALVAACQKTLKKGLEINCIPCPERM
jgi:arginyl-tRNA synthetase